MSFMLIRKETVKKEMIVIKLGKNRKVTHTVERITADNVRELRKIRYGL